MASRLNLRVHFPGWLTSLFPSAIWHLPTGNNTLYLTFDDGPIPEVTPDVLDILNRYNVKATFFSVGDNVAKYPKLYQRIIDEGHSVGNHTYNHLQGLKCSNKKYLQNIEKAASLIDSKMFRPPHGSLKRAQYFSVISQYKLIMWDVISCDYDQGLTPNQCFKNVIDFARDGSIITFHDSLKAKKNVLIALPKAIEFLLKQGYEFKKIEFPEDQPLKIHPAPVKLEAIKRNINRLLKGA